MEDERIRIELLPAPDEKMESPEYQQSLRDFAESLRANGISRSVGMRTMDAAGGVSPAVWNGGFGLAAATLPLITGFLGAWLKGRYGRKVRLKIGKHGEIDAEAQTVEQVKELVKTARKEPKRKKKSSGE
jgi:hypothetical protein